MAERKAVIKKYENRRLYDTGASRYVNLEDVARMVREGVEVQVVDARSGEDLTRVILTQVIVEDAKTKHILQSAFVDLNPPANRVTTGNANEPK